MIKKVVEKGIPDFVIPKKLVSEKARSPDFRGEGVSVWLNKQVNGIEYLNIKIVGHANIYARRV